jgi:hypothetical protein
MSQSLPGAANVCVIGWGSFCVAERPGHLNSHFAE